ncbi:MAG: hypothetical protein AB1552_08350 [Nitrospirota bacterium]
MRTVLNCFLSKELKEMEAASKATCP